MSDDKARKSNPERLILPKEKYVYVLRCPSFHCVSDEIIKHGKEKFLCTRCGLIFIPSAKTLRWMERNGLKPSANNGKGKP